MNDLLRDYLGKFVLAYLDDILIFSRTMDDHLQHLKIVLDILRENRLTVALEKCEFFKKELFYLGFIITNKGVQVDPSKISAIKDFPIPEDVSTIRSFLGMTGFFRKFIRNYAAMTYPLTELLKKNKVFEWNEDANKAFNALKDALCNAPVLKLPDWQSDSPFVIYTDASYKGIGGVLMQDGHAIAFESRKLNQAELNYPPTEIEMLAVVHCIKLWRCYIEGRETHIYTDHKPNTTFNTQAVLSRRQATWIDILQSYNLTWHYEKGEKMIADALSRNPVHDSNHKQVLLGVMRAKSSLKPSNLVKRLHDAYQDDPWFKETENVTKLVYKEGLYYNGSCIVVPNNDKIKQELMFEVHNLPYAGHPGRDKTIQLLSRQFWWPKMAVDVKHYIKHCDSCQRNKRSYTQAYGLLQPLPIPNNAWQSISMDFVVKLPVTGAGHDSILVVVDRLTKMTHLIACNETITAQNLANLFINNVFKLHGIPEQIITDRGSLFMSQFWKHFTQVLQIQRKVSTAYHPQTDGQTERVNQIMEDMLRHFVNNDQTNWDELLGLVEFAINNSFQDSVKATPFQLNYIHSPAMPVATLNGLPVKTNSATELAYEVTDIIKKAKQCLYNAQQRYKHYADNKRKYISFQEGDEVLLSTKNLTLKTVGTMKLMPKFVGPFAVSARINDVVYQLDLKSTLPIHNVFHVSLLKPYYPDSKVKPPPPPTIVNNEAAYDVEQILDHRDVRRGNRMERQYLVKWLNWGIEWNTWEPERNFNSTKCIQEYLNSLDKNAKSNTSRKRRRP